HEHVIPAAVTGNRDRFQEVITFRRSGQGGPGQDQGHETNADFRHGILRGLSTARGRRGHHPPFGLSRSMRSSRVFPSTSMTNAELVMSYAPVNRSLLFNLSSTATRYLPGGIPRRSLPVTRNEESSARKRAGETVLPSFPSPSSGEKKTPKSSPGFRTIGAPLLTTRPLGVNIPSA